jgi:curved DNA-binding protein
MQDYYQTLGVDPAASQDEIKNAYRKLAMKHHPDRAGGDDTQFKKIQEAYANVGDEGKRAEYEQMRRGGPQVRFTSGSMPDFGDIFGAQFDPFGNRSNPFGDMFGRRVAKNKDLNIQCQISFIDSYTGKQLEASYRMPSGKMQTVVINVPGGIEHGATIRYQGLGDDSFPNMPRGDLNVTILIQPDSMYERRDHDVYMFLEISPIEAMIGCSKTVNTLAGTRLNIDVRAGVETGVEYAVGGQGFNIVNSNIRGRFVAVIKIVAPAITNPDLIAKLRNLNDEINRFR